jgi:hypothetical protein
LSQLYRKMAYRMADGSALDSDGGGEDLLGDESLLFPPTPAEGRGGVGPEQHSESELMSVSGFGADAPVDNIINLNGFSAPLLAPGQSKLPVNQVQLQRAWDVSQRSTPDDWNEWMRRFTVELLRESPSSCLRSCSPLAQSYEPLARELFNAAFLSCWEELMPASRNSLVANLQVKTPSSHTPHTHLFQVHVTPLHLRNTPCH